MDRRSERIKYWDERDGKVPTYRNATAPELAGWSKMTRDEQKEAARQYRRRIYRERGGKEKSRAQARKLRCIPLWAEPLTCEVCGDKPSGKRLCLHLDHDHATGKFRGWLCRGCNLAIGNARDDPKLLKALANYLEQRG